MMQCTRGNGRGEAVLDGCCSDYTEAKEEAENKNGERGAVRASVGADKACSGPTQPHWAGRRRRAAILTSTRRA